MAVRSRHVGSWLVSLTTPLKKIRRNASHRNSQIRTADRSAKIARNPTSDSRMSHWKERKSCPTEQIDSHSTRHTASAARLYGAKIAASAKTAPPIHTAVKAPSVG